MNKKFCNIKELSEYLDVSIAFVRKLIYAKRIPFYKFGNRIRFDMQEIDIWVDLHKQKERKSILFM